jgi:hypothetical protein
MRMNAEICPLSNGREGRFGVIGPAEKPEGTRVKLSDKMMTRE